MKLMPEFQLGLLNGWWFSAAYVVINIIVMAAIPKGVVKRLTTNPAKTPSEKLSMKIQMILFFGVVIYPVFVTLKIGTAWFWSGLFIFIVGMIAYVVSVLNFAATPKDQPVDRGLFRISRNPIHVSSFVALLGVGIATASWVIISVNIIEQIMMHKTTLAEERFCLEKYGDSYRKYMGKVPRYFLFF
jgi:protein-S-isoprenylcysteine O-methyltransferase Ste14